MAKKINTDLPYYIDSWSISGLINSLDTIEEDSEITWNSFGGSVYAGQNMIDFLNNKKIKLTANVSSIAASMGAVLLPFFDHVKGSIQADVMIHAASGGAASTLKRTNEFLYQALAKKIDEDKFEQITGKKLKEVMMAEGENIVDVWLSGKQAKQIGLFDETYDLLERAASLEAFDVTKVNYNLPETIKQKYFKSNSNYNEMEIKNVTIEQLKSENPTVYNAIVNEGRKAEQERVAEIMEYGKYDMIKAEELVKSGKELSKQDVAYFIEKKVNAEKIDNLETNSAGDIKPANPPKQDQKTAEQKEKEAALAELDDVTGVTSYLKK